MKRIGLIEFAKRSGYTVRHIREQVQLGTIPALKDNTGRWKIKASLLKQWKKS